MKLFRKEKNIAGKRYYFCGLKIFERKPSPKGEKVYFLGIRLLHKKSNKLNLSLNSINAELNKLKNKLNATIDMSALPKAQGFKRLLQLLNLEIIAEIDRLCRKHNLKYWLSFGSALGAIRHQGYIPWDDDIDICMMHDDWLKFNELAPQEMLPAFKNIILPGDIGRVCMLDFSPTTDQELIDFLHWKIQDKLFFGVDIFPVHWLTDSIDEETAAAKLMEIRTWKENQRNQAKSDIHAHEHIQLEVDKKQSDLIAQAPSKRMFASMHSIHPVARIWHTEDVFPLRETSFEHLSLFIPHRAELLLWLQFGDFWEPIMSHTHISINNLSRREMIKLLTHAKRLGL